MQEENEQMTLSEQFSMLGLKETKRRKIEASTKGINLRSSFQPTKFENTRRTFSRSKSTTEITSNNAKSKTLKRNNSGVLVSNANNNNQQESDEEEDLPMQTPKKNGRSAKQSKTTLKRGILNSIE